MVLLLPITALLHSSLAASLQLDFVATPTPPEKTSAARRGARVNEMTAQMIIIGGRSISIVNDPSFRRFVEAVQNAPPGWKLPRRTSVTKLIDGLYPKTNAIVCCYAADPVLGLSSYLFRTFLLDQA